MGSTKDLHDWFIGKKPEHLLGMNEMTLHLYSLSRLFFQDTSSQFGVPAKPVRPYYQWVHPAKTAQFARSALSMLDALGERPIGAKPDAALSKWHGSVTPAVLVGFDAMQVATYEVTATFLEDMPDDMYTAEQRQRISAVILDLIEAVQIGGENLSIDIKSADMPAPKPLTPAQQAAWIDEAQAVWSSDEIRQALKSSEYALEPFENVNRRIDHTKAYWIFTLPTTLKDFRFWRDGEWRVDDKKNVYWRYDAIGQRFEVVNALAVYAIWRKTGAIFNDPDQKSPFMTREEWAAVASRLTPDIQRLWAEYGFNPEMQVVDEIGEITPERFKAWTDYVQRESPFMFQKFYGKSAPDFLDHDKRHERPADRFQMHYEGEFTPPEPAKVPDIVLDEHDKLVYLVDSLPEAEPPTIPVAYIGDEITEPAFDMSDVPSERNLVPYEPVPADYEPRFGDGLLRYDELKRVFWRFTPNDLGGFDLHEVPEYHE